MITYLNSSFYPKGCHKVGTDALVCPHKGGFLSCNVECWSGQTRVSVPTNSLSLQIELTTRLLVNPSTRQLHLIIILNFEL